MNKQRRKSLNALQDRLTAARVSVDAMKAEFEQMRDDLDTLHDEEQDSYDNMPGSQRDGEKGDVALDAIGRMDDAISTFEGFIDALDGDLLEEAFEALEDAKGQE